MKCKLMMIWMAAILALALVACDDGDDGSSGDGPAPNGTYTDTWGSTHDVSDTVWTASYPPDADGNVWSANCNITQINDGFLVCENEGMDNWSRYDWTLDGDDQYYCQIAFEATDEATALASDNADRSDLETGCAQFSWTLLTPVE